MKIAYNASNFPVTPGFVPTNGDSFLSCSWNDLVWAAITTGKPENTFLFLHRWHSFAEMIVRTYSIYANLLEKKDRIHRSQLFENLDPTEKGATSYFLGMVVAKLFATKLFNIPWVFHVSMASSLNHTVSFSKFSKSQPDLIGFSNSKGWLIFETKGRTNGFDQIALKSAKRQTQMINSINGVSPFLRVAMQMYFNKSQLEVRLDDPVEVESESFDLKVDLNRSFSQYYSLAQNIKNSEPRLEIVNGRKFHTIDIQDIGVTIGLDDLVLRSVLEKNINEDTLGYFYDFNDVGQVDDRFVVFPDGYLIRLGKMWDSEELKQDPIRR